MANSVYVVLRHDFESDGSSAGEFQSPTEVVGVFANRAKADEYVANQYAEADSSASDLPFGFEVEEHELQNDLLAEPESEDPEPAGMTASEAWAYSRRNIGV
jgi:hypothetical protein